ncbi:MAG: flagellar motor protein MotB [Janthinobacterium lividum]
MSEEGKERISLTIIRRKGKGHAHAHHGGAWKIAYADFVTAMMAFFLLMWLLGSTTKGEKQGIADFFNTPLSVALNKGSYSGGATSVLDGGGADMTKPQLGDVTHSDAEKSKAQKAAAAEAARAKPSADDMQRLKGLKLKIDALIDKNIKLKPFRNQIRIDITSEGLRIQITDEQNRPMFASGSPVLASYTKDILHEIGLALNDVDNRVSIAGHTDSAPYGGGDKSYSNWELSSERANAARRELIAGGMSEKKVIQVRGLADALPLVKADPAAPMNRRISILVLNHASEESFLKDRGRTDVSTPAEASAVLGASAPPPIRPLQSSRSNVPAATPAESQAALAAPAPGSVGSGGKTPGPSAAG